MFQKRITMHCCQVQWCKTNNKNESFTCPVNWTTIIPFHKQHWRQQHALRSATVSLLMPLHHVSTQETFVSASVWWTRRQSPQLPPASASRYTWGTVCCVPARLASRWWGSSAGRRRWEGPRACAGPGGGGPRSLCVQPLNIRLHLEAPAGGKQNHLLNDWVARSLW